LNLWSLQFKRRIFHKCEHCNTAIAAAVLDHEINNPTASWVHTDYQVVLQRPAHLHRVEGAIVDGLRRAPEEPTPTVVVLVLAARSRGAAAQSVRLNASGLIVRAEQTGEGTRFAAKSDFAL
jgi:hypothetical protein